MWLGHAGAVGEPGEMIPEQTTPNLIVIRMKMDKAADVKGAKAEIANIKKEVQQRKPKGSSAKAPRMAIICESYDESTAWQNALGNQSVSRFTFSGMNNKNHVTNLEILVTGVADAKNKRVRTHTVKANTHKHTTEKKIHINTQIHIDHKTTTTNKYAHTNNIRRLAFVRSSKSSPPAWATPRSSWATS